MMNLLKLVRYVKLKTSNPKLISKEKTRRNPSRKLLKPMQRLSLLKKLSQQLSLPQLLNLKRFQYLS